MADRIDRLLSDYYSGRLQNKVTDRIIEIETSTNNDENIGGGRAQNKHSRPVDDMIIRKEQDVVLNKCRADLNYVTRLVKRIEDSFDPDVRNVVKFHFDKRLGQDWLAIESLTGIGTRQGQRYVNWFKREVGNVFWYDKGKEQATNFIKKEATMDDLAEITSLIKNRLKTVDN